MSITISHRDLPHWIGLRQQDDGRYDLGQVKAELARREVNSRGWRLYLDYGDDLFSPLRGPWIGAHSARNNLMFAVIWLRLLQSCEMDVPPPPELARSLRDWDFPGNGFGHTPPHFLRAAWKACLAAAFSGASLDTFVDREIVPVARWFFGSGAFREIDPGQLKAGWNTVCRLYDEWRWEQTPQHGREEWHPFVRVVEWGSFRVLALSSQAALKAESRAMSHCIEIYADLCRRGEVRAYSVRERDSGKRLATATMHYDSSGRQGRWSIGEVRGHRNEPVSCAIHEAHEALYRCYQDIPTGFFASHFAAQMAAGRVSPLLPVDDEPWECDLL